MELMNIGVYNPDTNTILYIAHNIGPYNVAPYNFNPYWNSQGIVIRNGNVVFRINNSIINFNPYTNTLVTTLINYDTKYFQLSDACLLPNGNIIFFGIYSVIYDPNTNLVTDGPFFNFDKIHHFANNF